MSLVTGDVLWRPPADVLQSSRIGHFSIWLREHRGLDLPDHEALWRWSVTDLDGFWSAIWDFFGVADHGQRTAVLSERVMPGTQWFPGSRLNYAEHALRGAGADDSAVAVKARSQTRPDLDLSWGELRAQVARARQVLVDLGVQAGDRVAGYLPNCPEALIAFLAAAGLGAVWTSCALEFGPRSVIDRFGQVEPVDPARCRRLPLRAQGGRPTGRSGRSRGGVAHRDARARHRVRPVAGGRRPVLVRAAGRVRPFAAGDRRRCPSTIRSSSCSPPAPPESPRRSCTATAASSSSI